MQSNITTFSQGKEEELLVFFFKKRFFKLCSFNYAFSIQTLFLKFGSYFAFKYKWSFRTNRNILYSLSHSLCLLSEALLPIIHQLSFPHPKQQICMQKPICILYVGEPCFKLSIKETMNKDLHILNLFRFALGSISQVCCTPGTIKFAIMLVIS